MRHRRAGQMEQRERILQRRRQNYYVPKIFMILFLYTLVPQI